MSFKSGDIPFFKEYLFTDNGKTAKHFALVLLPEDSTKFSNSLLCCVITSRQPKRWGFLLRKSKYNFFDRDSFICFDRKDLVSKSGLADGSQPRGKLDVSDFREVFKDLKKSLFVIKDLANDPYLRGVIIYEWKAILKNLP